MGLFSKLKNLITRKKDVAKLIKNKNEKQTLIEQKKFDSGLHKSSSALNHSIDNLAKKYRRLDDELIESIEEMLLMYDIGPMSTEKILNAIIEEIKYQNVTDPELIKQIIIDKLFVYYIQDADVHTNIELTKDKMNVILVSGVNGVGKTTSIAKLSNKYKKEGYDVCLIAADTFRAGAIEQLDI
jgi:fused signal recognition particle receptor